MSVVRETFFLGKESNGIEYMLDGSYNSLVTLGRDALRVKLRALGPLPDRVWQGFFVFIAQPILSDEEKGLQSTDSAQRKSRK